ncbi:MAG: hypothetical protein AAGF79_08910 [Pseudomonadota bacterium]
MTDAFDTFTSGLESPATHVVGAVPSDSTDLPVASRGINVAGSGTVRVTTVGGTTETIYVVAGAAFPIRASRIWQTGTTATDIVVMY